jgi:hypothetical protein
MRKEILDDISFEEMENLASILFINFPGLIFTI